jgi:hypothetical protein
VHPAGCMGGRNRGNVGVMRVRVLSAAVRGIGAVLITLSLMAARTQAQAQAPAGASCSAAFHSAMGEVLAKQGESLGGAVAAMRAPDATLPGSWLYAQSLFPVKKNKLPAVERPCAERVKVAGRMRCVRYEDGALADVPSELTIAPLPSTEELRIIKLLNDLVEGRGGVPEVGNNGRYYWMSQRAASDLKMYMSQPSHPALCSGGKDFAEFYAQTLGPLQKRIGDVGELAKKARALAVARVKEAVGLKVGAQVLDSGGVITKQFVAPEIAADASLVTLVAEAAGVVVPAPVKAEIAAEMTPLAALRRAKLALVAVQVAAQDDAIGRELVLAAGRAVRMLEAAAYGDIYVERYKRFSVDVLQTPQAIKAAHTKACTCGL